MTTISISALPAKTGTINDAAYLHLNESSVDKKVSIIQLLAKISDQYTTDIVTFLGSADSAAARASLGIDRRTTVSDANYTILATDKVVAQNGTMSAARTFSLPAASTFPVGGFLIIIDGSGSVTPTNKITVQRDGTDVIDGSTSLEITKAYGSLILVCNGTDGWKNLYQDISFPTIQKFTSGSGTYTTPLGVKSICVKMVGAGGGGAGSGSGTSGGGGAGGASTFGSSLLTANGGSGGITDATIGGAGGTASLGSGSIGTAIQGGYGQSSVVGPTNSDYSIGGAGGSSALGGAGSSSGGSNFGNAGAGISNTGGGGGGAGGRSNATFGGCGGGAGGFIDAIINSPASSYSYAVGAGGAGGTAGTIGQTGGAGGSGYIVVTEYY